MPALVVEGRKLAQEIRAEVRLATEKLEGPPPGLATIQVGQDPASTVYVRNKHRACAKVGIRSRQIDLPESISESALLEHISELNADPEIHGILVQLPLPNAIDASRVAEQIAPEKDVDGLHPRNVGELVAGRDTLVSCTPRGCMEVLRRHSIEISGARAVVLGRSNIVGKPMGMLLLHANATVTYCHSKTRDLPDIVRQADIVVAAIGRPQFVLGDWIKPGAAVIDVGINRLEDGRLVGDVDFESASEQAGLITPVPGGIGLLTVAMLMVNTLEARCRLGSR